MNETVAIIGGIVAILGSIGGLAFNMGKVSSNLTRNTEMTTLTYQIVSEQDDRIQDLENNMLPKKDFNEFMQDRFVPLETKHKAHHKE